MASTSRQRIIESNRSLRTIKNELETLLERGILPDSAYDSIMSLLPPETSLSSAAVPTVASTTPSIPTPNLPIRRASPNPSTASSAAIVDPPPPAYTQTTPSNSTPHLPPRKTPSATSSVPPPQPIAVAAAAAAVTTTAPPPPPAAVQQPPSKPILKLARALYKYNAQDSRDCSFEKDHLIEVYEEMNNDWWMGRNKETGAEGIFPCNYVRVVDKEEASSLSGGATAVAGYPPPPQQQQQPHGGGNPYNTDVPPMSVANSSSSAQHHDGEGGEGNKGKEMGKKFGKKLGNAAIFGAGATMGSNLVNSIF